MRFLVLIPLLFLGACLKSTQPPVTMYALHPAQQQAPAGRLPVMAVAEPEVPAGFDTNRIALYLDGGRRMDYYAGAAWPENFGKVMQDFIMKSMTGAIAVTEQQDVVADYTLHVKVNEFAPVYAGTATAAPVLKVSLSFLLVSTRNDRVLASFTVDREVQAAENRMGSVTAGLESLAQGAMSDALPQLETRLKRPKAEQ